MTDEEKAEALKHAMLYDYRCYKNMTGTGMPCAELILKDYLHKMLNRYWPHITDEGNEL